MPGNGNEVRLQPPRPLPDPHLVVEVAVGRLTVEGPALGSENHHPQDDQGNLVVRLDVHEVRPRSSEASAACAAENSLRCALAKA